jgi:pyoverdine/dityrosine biosynthesis protein Dit1
MAHQPCDRPPFSRATRAIGTTAARGRPAVEALDDRAPNPDREQDQAGSDRERQLIDGRCGGPRDRVFLVPGGDESSLQTGAGRIQPWEPADIAARATAVLRRLFRYRRLSPSAGGCAGAPCEHCLAPHLPRVRHSLRTGQPIHLVLPAFPAKSPSRRKTLGPLPDRAEELGLLHLQAVVDEMTSLHPPGVRLTVCSDGHVFSDLVGVTDEETSTYGRHVRETIERLGLSSLDTFDMADRYESNDFASMRRQLVAEYAQPREEIEDRTRRSGHHRSLFNGIHRFLFEEQSGVRAGQSRTSLREECKGTAYEVIRRSDAWGRLIADCFPAALRLSIHPQDPHAEKIGILLGEADDAWQTPWHGVALHHPGGWKFVKRHEAEALGARLVERDGRPSHFELMEAKS